MGEGGSRVSAPMDRWGGGGGEVVSRVSALMDTWGGGGGALSVELVH